MQPYHIDLEQIVSAKLPGRKLPGFVMRYLKHIVHIDEVNRTFELYPDARGLDFIGHLIDYLGISYTVEGHGHLPHDGRTYTFASNHPLGGLDGIILASSCDKSIPAHLKAAARMNVPTIFMPGGSMRPGPNQTTSLVAGDISLRQKRKDAITEQEVRDYKLTGCPSVGACTFLGTASTMQCVAEALGMTLPGAALVPATMRDLLQYARYAGRKIMELVEKNITPSQIMTPCA